MRVTASLALILALAACGALDEVRDDARGVTERHACVAALSCERELAVVLEDVACVADDERARDEALERCDAEGAARCSGARYWRCDVECEAEANPAPCVP